MESSNINIMDDAYWERFALFHEWRPNGGKFGEMYWTEFLYFLNEYWDESNVSDHFSDCKGLDFLTYIGGCFERHHEQGDILKGRKGFISVGVGRNPLRYTPTVYVPVEVWFDKSVNDTSYIHYLVDAYDEAFRNIMDKAMRKKGRLANPEKTWQVWNNFVETARQFKPKLPDEEIWERERKRSVRRNLIPDQFAK